MKAEGFTEELEQIKSFKCNGKPMVLVRSKNVAHVMAWNEWKHAFGRVHDQEKYNNTDWKARCEKMDRIHEEKKAKRNQMKIEQKIAG